jgi:hypothetical protein
MAPLLGSGTFWLTTIADLAASAALAEAKGRFALSAGAGVE